MSDRINFSTILIPALEPQASLLSYIDDLTKAGFKRIIVVNDGSGRKYDVLFEKIQEHPQCIVLKHAVNMGKGRALKTGLNFYLNEYAPESVGIISVDSDGQHSVQNVVDIDKILCQQFADRQTDRQTDLLVLGCRNFACSNVPFKSKFGNLLTSWIFHLLYCTKISDTQTGLRGFSNETAQKFLTLYGERFEFETNMLIYARRLGISIKEIPIETIYIEGNRYTHFRPVHDSLKIYALLLGEFFRFSLISLSSFVVDMSLFYMFTLMLYNYDLKTQIFVATAGARAVSSMFNCMMNKKVVFNSTTSNAVIIPKYYLLCVFQAACSAAFLYLLSSAVPLSRVILKAMIDIMLFFVSYEIQKNFIYVPKVSD